MGNGTDLGMYYFPRKATESVKIEADLYNGAREIEFWNVQAGPEKLYIAIPSGVQQPCGGCYHKTTDAAQGFPIWKQENGERWLYLGTNQHWYIGDTLEKGKEFKTTSGFIVSRTAGN